MCIVQNLGGLGALAEEMKMIGHGLLISIVYITHPNLVLQLGSFYTLEDYNL